ncbi:hypothetical protein LCGC14_3011750, partial [marine sediment metagenome]
QWRFGADGRPPRKDAYRATVRVPGACQLDDQTQEVGVWYRKVFPMPATLGGKDPSARWLLRFAKAGWYTRAYLNGKPVGKNFGSSTPFEFDVTEAIRWGADNELAVHLHAADASHTVGGALIGDLYESISFRSGGRKNRNWVQILGDVTLHKRPAAHIAWQIAETSVRKGRLRLRGRVGLPAGRTAKGLSVHAQVASLDEPDRIVLTAECPLTTGKQGQTFDSTVAWKEPVLWGFGKYGKAHLYGLRLELRDAAGAVLDATVRRFGFREIWYDGRKLMLNGKELFIAAAAEPHGLEPVTSYHYADGVFERNNMVRFCQVLRKFGWNAVHNHFDTYGEAAYDVADELGLLVVAGFYCSGPAWLT